MAEIANNAFITREELAVACGITQDGVKWQLKKMQERGLIARIGFDKGGYWQVLNG